MLLKSIFAGAAAAATLVHGAAIERQTIQARTNDGTCVIDEAAPQTIRGGGATGSVCESRWPVPNFINRITTWHNKWHSIVAMEIGYADGQSAKYGKGFWGTQQEIRLAPGERITRATIHDNDVGDRLGKIHIETTKQTVDLGDSPSEPFEVDVGAGFIIAMLIGSGDEIDRAGLVMLGGKIDKIEIGEFQFKDDPSTTGPPTEPKWLSRIHFYNGDTSNGTYSFEGDSGMEASTTVSSSTTGEFGMEYKWSMHVGVPNLFTEVGGSAKWSVSHTTLNSLTTTSKDGTHWKQGGILPPGHAVNCHALVQTGEGDFPYTSTVTMHLSNGKTYSYPEQGVLHSVQYTTIDHGCDAADPQQVPDGYDAKPIAATVTDGSDGTNGDATNGDATNSSSSTSKAASSNATNSDTTNSDATNSDATNSDDTSSNATNNDATNSDTSNSDATNSDATNSDDTSSDDSQDTSSNNA